MVAVYDVITQLPGIDTVRRHCKSIAMLDSIMSSEWQFRYYSFNSQWGPGEEMASMRDGKGTEYPIVFSSAGAYARGFDHDSALSPYRQSPAAPWPGLFSGVPETFQPLVAEAAFCDANHVPLATVCFWRQTHQSCWQAGVLDLPAGSDDPDGAAAMFTVLTDSTGELYRQFAEEYYECRIDFDAVAHVYRGEALTEPVVRALNPDVRFRQLAHDIAEIGYPC